MDRRNRKATPPTVNGHSEEDARNAEVDPGLLCTPGAGCDRLMVDGPDTDASVQDLVHYLEQRIDKRKQLSVNLEHRFNDFHLDLMDMEREKIALHAEVEYLKSKLRMHKDSIELLNRKLDNRERQINELMRQRKTQLERPRRISQLTAIVERKEHEFSTPLRKQSVVQPPPQQQHQLPTHGRSMGLTSLSKTPWRIRTSAMADLSPNRKRPSNVGRTTASAISTPRSATVAAQDVVSGCNAAIELQNYKRTKI